MTNLDRRDMLRRGGAAALFAGLAGVLTQSAVVAEAGAALEAAPEAKKPGLTLRLLKENRVLEARCSELRTQYESLKRAFGDLSLLFERGGSAWRDIRPENLEGMDDLLDAWRWERGGNSYVGLEVQKHESALRYHKASIAALRDPKKAKDVPPMPEQDRTPLQIYAAEREREMRILRETVESRVRAADERAEIARDALKQNMATLRKARARIKQQKEQLENQGAVIRRWREAQRVREGGVA